LSPERAVEAVPLVVPFIAEAIWPTNGQAADGPECPMSAMVSTIEELVYNGTLFRSGHVLYPLSHPRCGLTLRVRSLCMEVGRKEVEAVVDQLSASLSTRLAANTALLESGTVPADLDALLAVIDELSVSGVIGVNNGLTPAACMRAATLALSVRGFLPALIAPCNFIHSSSDRLTASPPMQLLQLHGNYYDGYEGSYLTYNMGDLERCAVHTLTQLLSRFHDTVDHADLQTIVSQCMTLLPRLGYLSAELTRVLGAS
jgi:hypothetical protein